MKLEELIQKLHEEVDYNRHANCDDMTDGASDCPSCCGNQYFGDQAVTYGCEQKRKVYAVRYLPVHIFENFSGMSLIPADSIKKVLNKKAVNVLSIGGGPGSDAAGFKRYIASMDDSECPCKEFKIIRIDRENGWNDLSQRVNALYLERDRKFDHRRQEFDVSQNIEWLEGKAFDVVLISYLISELQDEQVGMLATNLEKCLRSEAILVINDRDQPSVNVKVEQLVTKLNRKVVKSGRITSNCGVDFSSDIKKMAKPKIMASSKIHIC